MPRMDAGARSTRFAWQNRHADPVVWTGGKIRSRTMRPRMGGGVMTVAAAVAPLARRIAVDVGPDIPLPKLPPSDVVLHSRAADARLAGTLRVLAAAFRSTTRQITG
jgi:hypothetical protein